MEQNSNKQPLDHPLQGLLTQPAWNHGNDALLLQTLKENPILGQWLKSLASKTALQSLTEPINLLEDNAAEEARRLVWSRAQLSVFTVLLETVALSESLTPTAGG